MRNPNQPCLTPGNIIAWGQLAFASPDLARLEQSLVKLAFDTKPETRQFRDRYYFYAENRYEVLGAQGKQTYAIALYFVIADNAGMIDSRPESPAPASFH